MNIAIAAVIVSRVGEGCVYKLRVASSCGWPDSAALGWYSGHCAVAKTHRT